MPTLGPLCALLPRTIVSEGGKTYIDSAGNTQELVEGQKYVFPDNAQGFWCTSVPASEDYGSATTQRKANEAVAALRAAVATLEAATKTFVPSAPMHRLYSQWSGEHFCTSSGEEHDFLLEVGWRDEGIGWYGV